MDKQINRYRRAEKNYKKEERERKRTERGIRRKKKKAIGRNIEKGGETMCV
jgi:hypothetical protein